MINITRLNHVALNTPENAGELETFYTQHLSVKTVPRDIPEEFASVIPGFWMQFDNAQVHVIENSAEHSPGNPMGRHVAFYVDDLEATEAYLKDNGIEYQRMDQFVFACDPAGNTLEFQQDPECN